MAQDDADIGTNEHTPLLSTHESQPGSHPRLAESTRFRAITLCYVFIILIEIGVYLQVSPLNAVIEQTICRKYYPDIGGGTDLALIQDSRCKNVEIQGELSMLRGWQSMFEFIPGMLTAVPYGLATDKYGRKPILRLVLLGITLQTWFSSVFLLIGGGQMVLNSILFVIVADTASESKSPLSRLRTALSGCKIDITKLGGEIIGTPLASISMKFDPWIPIFLGFIVIASTNLVLLALPETSNMQQSKYSSRNTTIISELFVPENVPNPILEWVHNSKNKFKVFVNASWATVGDRNVLLLLTTFLVATLGRYAQEILMQYVSKRYAWTWSQAGLLLSIRAFANLILLLAILPASSHFLTRYMSLGSQQKDLWLARASAFLLASGAFCIGVAPTAALMMPGLIIFALGVGLTLIVRSLIASLVHSDQLGTLYSVIAVLESMGALIAGPMLSLTFREGLRIGGSWIGLPWISASFLLSLALIALSLVKLNASSMKAASSLPPTFPSTKFEYDVSLVQGEDIPVLAELTLDAKVLDPMTSSIFPPSNLDSTKAFVATRLLDILRNDRTSTLIKVQSAEGSILGFARWQTFVTLQDEQAIEERINSRLKGMVSGFDTEAFERIKATILDTRKKHIDSSTAYTLAFIAVQPLHRREGVARALLQWGLQCADEAGADTWVESLSVTVPFYEKYGWVTMDEVKMDNISASIKDQSLFGMLRKPIVLETSTVYSR